MNETQIAQDFVEPSLMAATRKPSNRSADVNGWIEIKRNPISKVGVFPYRGASIGAPDPDRIYMVLRPEEELSSPECIESFKLLPWIDEHTMLGPAAQDLAPGVAVSAERKGVQGVIGQEVIFEYPYLLGNLKIFSDSMGDKIDLQGKRELSAGYRCTYEFTPGVFDGVEYDAIQRNIRGNHIALVEEGRCGPDVAVLDHLKITFDAKDLVMNENEAKPAEGGGEGGPTIAELMEQIKAIMPVVAQVQEMQAMLSKLVAVEKAEGHPELEEDACAKDEEKEDETPAVSMDAAEIRRSVLKEIAARDAMAKSLSEFVGVFDHAEMDLASVAKYGIEKLGIPAEVGGEVPAVRAWLHGRKPAEAVAMDGKESSSKSVIADLYSKE